MNPTDLRNGTGMWLVCSVMVVVVLFQALRLAFIALAAGRKIDMPREKMWAAFRCGVTTSIVPSIAVLVGLAVLVPAVGFPFAWMRLSVVGSVTYELLAASAAASQLGLESLGADKTGVAMTVAIWAMSLGVIFNLLFVGLFTPRINALKMKVAGGDKGWMQVMTVAAFFGAVGYMAAQPAVRGGASLVALSGGFVATAILGVIIKVGRQKWLREWTLALAIIAGMAAAGFWAHLQGG